MPSLKWGHRTSRRFNGFDALGHPPQRRCTDVRRDQSRWDAQRAEEHAAAVMSERARIFGAAVAQDHVSSAVAVDANGYERRADLHQEEGAWRPSSDGEEGARREHSEQERDLDDEIDPVVQARDPAALGIAPRTKLQNTFDEDDERPRAEHDQVGKVRSVHG